MCCEVSSRVKRLTQQRCLYEIYSKPCKIRQREGEEPIKGIGYLQEIRQTYSEKQGVGEQRDLIQSYSLSKTLFCEVYATKTLNSVK